MDPVQTRNVLEACLLVAARPMTVPQLDALFEEDIDRPDRKAIREALAVLADDYADRGVELVEVAGGWRLQTRASMEHWVARLSPEKAPRYSRALLETLVLIAYRQPITRGEIEEVRGVAVSSNIVRTLQDRRWVREVGFKEVPGKPALLGTTSEFLDYFNLKRLDELPPLGELKDIDGIEAVLAAELDVVEGGEAANDEDGEPSDDAEPDGTASASAPSDSPAAEAGTPDGVTNASVSSGDLPIDASAESAAEAAPSGAQDVERHGEVSADEPNVPDVRGMVPETSGESNASDASKSPDAEDVGEEILFEVILEPEPEPGSPDSSGLSLSAVAARFVTSTDANFRSPPEGRSDDDNVPAELREGPIADGGEAGERTDTIRDTDTDDPHDSGKSGNDVGTQGTDGADNEDDGVLADVVEAVGERVDIPAVTTVAAGESSVENHDDSDAAMGAVASDGDAVESDAAEDGASESVATTPRSAHDDADEGSDESGSVGPVRATTPTVMAEEAEADADEGVAVLAARARDDQRDVSAAADPLAGTDAAEAEADAVGSVSGAQARMLDEVDEFAQAHRRELETRDEWKAHVASSQGASPARRDAAIAYPGGRPDDMSRPDDDAAPDTRRDVPPEAYRDAPPGREEAREDSPRDGPATPDDGDP